MGEFVRKTLVGYKEIPGGRADPECTHVILSLKEYEEQLRRIAAAEQETQATKREAEKAIRSAKSDAQYKIQIAESEAAEIVADLEGELEKERQESTYQRGLNKNLLRIAKERANADRKLKPKKEHTGYFIVYTGEKDYNYRRERRKLHRATLWETILQSPYSVDFSEGQARKQIQEDLFEQGANNSWLVSKIGISMIYSYNYEKLIELDEWETKFKEANILLRPNLKLRISFRTGYWEAIILHTKPLDVVPPEMRIQ